jgi:hypothetical protein
MPDIMVLFACLSPCIDPTPLRQLGRGHWCSFMGIALL